MTGQPIHTLRLGQCRYAITPHDTDRHLFCGEPVEYPGCPYCPTHAAVCFDRRPSEKRRADAERAAAARLVKAQRTLRAGSIVPASQSTKGQFGE